MTTPEPIRTRKVQCKQCLAMTEIREETDPHSVTFCGCCTQDHHHGEAAAACSPEQHDGQPCWNPPAVPKPDGCGVCRPIVHFGATNVSFVI